MNQQIVQQMFQAGVHLGHRRRQRNPKTSPYIYTEKDDLQIIDLLQTYGYLHQACFFLFDACQKGQSVLFVGTKKHIAKYVEETAHQCQSWYITQRWLGGFLTNWETIQKTILKEKNSSIPKTKKEAARYKRQKARFEKYFGGVQTMSKRPDIVIIIDQQHEMNAVRECQKFKNIRSLTFLDTNCDPSLTDFFIPANDDSLASVQLILTKLAQAIQEGQKIFRKNSQIHNQLSNNSSISL